MSLTPDKNYRSIADTSFLFFKGESINALIPTDYDDILKISNSTNIDFVDCDINWEGGNREDGVDIMRESVSITFKRCFVGAGAKYAFTIKGGSHQVMLDRCRITRGGGGWERVDIDIGNFSSTTPNAKTGLVVLNDLRRADGKPVRVRVGWAKKPIVYGGDVKILFWQSLGLKVYVQIMRLLTWT